jgi:molybdate transport system ATP-binding protein
LPFPLSRRLELEIAFEIERGLTALSGPSGSGKTTTLHLIAGLLRPDRGRIALGDRALFDAAAKIDIPSERRRMGLVFQDYQLFPHLSVEANLRYGLKRNPPHALDFHHLVEVLELAPYLKRYPATLSGGQKQRVAFGRAIAANPAVLLLDEPVSALDEDLKESVLAFLKRLLAEYPIPTLLVTHDRRSLEKLAVPVIEMPQRGLAKKRLPAIPGQPHGLD